jgi:Tfp pilus assembly protein PilP
MKKSAVLFVLGLLALGGCAEKAPEGTSVQKMSPGIRPSQSVPPSSAPQPGPNLPPKEKPAVPAPVEKLEPPLAAYDPRGKPDPFLPAEATQESKGGKKIKVLPLEQFEVSEYELVGIVTGSGLRKAMIQDLSGKGYLVQVGTPLGKRGGKIIRIADREVVIEELFQDFLGRKSVRQVSLKLPQI